MFTAYKVTINGTDVSSFVKVGMITTDKLDEELADAVVILNNTNNATPYTPFSKVFIELIGHTEAETYVVLQDEVIRQANNTIYYQHKLSLLEPTKWAEKIMLPDLTFRQPINSEWTPYSVWSAIIDIQQQCPLDSSTKYWQLDSELVSSPYTTTLIPEISLHQNNLREALSKVFAVLNMIPRFYLDTNGNYVLTAVKVNQLNNKVDLNTTKTFEYRQNRSGEYFGGALETRLENGTQKYATLKYPSVGWGACTSGDKSPLTSDNIVLELPFPIYKVDKLEVWITTTDLAGNKNGSMVWDITDDVVSKDKYDLLPEINGTNAYTTQTKGSALYYTVGDNKIYNFSYLYSRKTFFDNITGVEAPTIEYIMNRMEGRTAGNITWSSSGERIVVLFRCQVKTSLSSTIRNYKEEVAQGQVFNNQAENLVDMLDFGNSNFGVINKIGNSEINIAKLVPSGQEYQLGDYTSDGWIISSITNQYQKDGYVISTATLTKNFNQISKYVGVDSSIRQVPIPYAQQVARLHYDDFCIVSKTANTGAVDSYRAVNGNFLSVFAQFLGGDY